MRIDFVIALPLPFWDQRSADACRINFTPDLS